jgi:cobalt/nickel transport system permease protein
MDQADDCGPNVGGLCMHMADALLSPAVGGIMWAASAAAVARSSRKIQQELDGNRIPLMGMLAAFVFTAQMINFSIPGTGSSGHLGGGLLLAILLGPDAALLATASVLVIQALFFADGGLLALGCNIFNLGFLPAFVAYPLVFRPLATGKAGQLPRALAVLLGAVVGLQLGAFGVVVETVLSGRTALTFRAFLLAMQPIHLAIGLVEGVVTLSLLAFLQKARLELPRPTEQADTAGRATVALGLLTLLLGGWVAWYASKHPDGLEWAIQRVTGQSELQGTASGWHGRLARVQATTAVLPDYQFKGSQEGSRAVTSLSGVMGGAMTLVLVAGAGWILHLRKRRA